MDISAASSSSVESALEIKSLQLAKSQQEAEGEASIQLLEAAAVSQPSSANLALGSNVDTYA